MLDSFFHFFVSSSQQSSPPTLYFYVAPEEAASHLVIVEEETNDDEFLAWRLPKVSMISFPKRIKNPCFTFIIVVGYSNEMLQILLQVPISRPQILAM